MIRMRLVPLVAAIALHPALSAAATIDLVTTPFPSPLHLETFEGNTYDPFYTFTSTGGLIPGDAVNLTHDVTPSGEWGLTTWPARHTIHIGFAGPVFAGGMWFGNDDSEYEDSLVVSLDLFGAGDTLLGTVSVVANMNDWADQFIGFTSDTPVHAALVRYGSGTDKNLYAYIDDLQVAELPEPSSMLLLGTGLVGAAVRRWKRNRVAAD